MSKSTHGGIDDIKLEKEIGGLSVLTEIVQHNRNSVLRGKVGKEHSHDLVGIEVRELLEENAAKFNPFNKSRKTCYVFNDKPKKGLFDGLTIEHLEKFIKGRKREYNLKIK